jgi:hypothetical protein
MIIRRLLIVFDNHSSLRSRLFPTQIVSVEVEVTPMLVLSNVRGLLVNRAWASNLLEHKCLLLFPVLITSREQSD